MAQASSSYEPSTGIEKWVDQRLPIPRLMHDQFLAFPTPRNLNYWWTFGGILTVMLAVQIVTGIVLAMHYTPHVDHAFNSVETIMRDVNYGWLLRYVHSNGASMFFLARDRAASSSPAWACNAPQHTWPGAPRMR